MQNHQNKDQNTDEPKDHKTLGFERRLSSKQKDKIKTKALFSMVMWNVAMVIATVLIGYLYIYGIMDDRYFVGMMLAFTVVSNLITWIITIYLFYWGKQAKVSIEDINWTFDNFLNDVYQVFGDFKEFKAIAVGMGADIRELKPFFNDVLRIYHSNKKGMEIMLKNLERMAELAPAFNEEYGDRLDKAAKMDKEHQKELIRSMMERRL